MPENIARPAAKQTTQSATNQKALHKPLYVQYVIFFSSVEPIAHYLFLYYARIMVNIHQFISLYEDVFVWRAVNSNNLSTILVMRIEKANVETPKQFLIVISLFQQGWSGVEFALLKNITFSSVHVLKSIYTVCKWCKYIPFALI